MSLRTLNELLRFRKAGWLDDLKAVCDIGATELNLNGNGMAVRNFLAAFGGGQTLSDAEIQRWSGGEHAEKLWRACGFEYLAIDMSTEIQTLGLDLNFDSVPRSHRGRYQLVLNFGTTEHVCNQLNAMKIIHDLTSPGGLMYHVVPFSGYQNHGFFRYNAKFFWSLCRSNEYGYRDLFVDFTAEPEPLHPDIVTNMKEFGHDLDAIARFSTVEGVLRVVLQKSQDTHFKPPFDGIVGNVANEIPARYHEVFRDTRTT
jgi:hypothetical protein